jgi:hypothetical protein
MRPTPWIAAEPYRIQPRGLESEYGDTYGVFMIPHGRTGVTLRVIVSDGDYKAAGLPVDYAWEHVSVSLPGRCPNWPEMSFIKSVFWRDEETVMELHVPVADHLSLHPHCLHLWRPLNAEIPRPPSDTVAIPGDLEANRNYRVGSAS